MLDRLIAGAGAVTDLADRAVRAILRTAGSRVADTRPGSVALAAILLLAAAGLVLVGLESLNAGGLRTIAPADVPDDDALGGRVHATIEGGLLSSYVETYLDTDGDGTQDEDETGDDWAYWLVDPETREGVTVLSLGAPWDVFTGAYSGAVVNDTQYVSETPFIADELSALGVTLDPDHVIDASATGPATEHTLGETVPAEGTLISVSGSRSVGYATSCSVDSDGDGTCGDDEVDTFDVAIFDRATGVGILVVTDEDPDLLPMSLTGILRRDASTVTAMANAPGPTLEDYGISVSPTYVLEVGATPADPGAALLLALLAGLLGVVILVGLVGGYVGYRKTEGRPAGVSSLTLGDAIPVRLTGIVRSPRGDTHVRDVPAVLRRFALGQPAPAAPTGDAAPVDSDVLFDDDAPDIEAAAALEPDPAIDPNPAIEPDPAIEPAERAASATPATNPAPGGADAGTAIPLDSTVIVERVGRPEGVALGMGELQRLSVGSATTFRGSRPAIRATAGTGQLILSFDDAAVRDRAAAELVAEAGLDLERPVGATAPAPIPAFRDIAPPEPVAPEAGTPSPDPVPPTDPTDTEAR